MRSKQTQSNSDERTGKNIRGKMNKQIEAGEANQNSKGKCGK